MRVLLLVAALGAALWWQYPDVYHRAAVAAGLANPPPAETLLFTSGHCGTYCRDFASVLDERGVAYREVDVESGDEARQLLEDAGGGNTVPMLVMGGERLVGYNRMDTVSFLAERRGDEVLTPAERLAMRTHFDDDGKPRVVMYGTEWCGYCKRARSWFTAHGVAWIERDVEHAPTAAEDFRVLGGGGTPLIYIGYHRINGFDEQRLVAALGH